MLASLTLLPALLGFAGEQVEVTRWRGLIAAGLVAVGLVGVGLKLTPLLVALSAGRRRGARRQPGLRPAASARCRAGRRKPPRADAVPTAGAARSSTTRGPAAIGGHGAARGARPAGRSACASASPTRATTPKTTTTRKAYDLLADGFGPGFNGPLLLVAEVPAGHRAADLGAAITEAVAGRPRRGVRLADAVPTDPDAPHRRRCGRSIPTTAPQDEATTTLVNRLRDDVLPPVERGHRPRRLGHRRGVAVNVDFSDYLAARLPCFFGAVLTLSFLLLMVVFRSCSCRSRP